LATGKCSVLSIEQVRRMPFPKRSIAKEIALADDCEEIVRFLAGHEFPFLFRLALRFSFLPPFAVPAIAKSFNDAGVFAATPLRRFEGTELFLAIVIDYGLDSDEARAALSKVNAAHAKYRATIANHDLVLVLALMTLTVVDFIEKYGYRPCTEHEKSAVASWFGKLGDRMLVVDPPRTPQQAHDIVDEATAARYAPSAEGRRLARLTVQTCLRVEFGESLLARACVYPVAKTCFLVLVPDAVRPATDFPRPHAAVCWVVTHMLYAIALFISLFRGDRKHPQRHSEMPLHTYPRGLNQYFQSCPFTPEPPFASSG